MGNAASGRNLTVMTDEEEDNSSGSALLHQQPDMGSNTPVMAVERTWRIDDLCDMWGRETRQNPREILEQFVQGFFQGEFERNNRPDTIAEGRNERVASQSFIPISVVNMLKHMKADFRNAGLNQSTAGLLSIIDWERMGDRGERILRLIRGLRLTQVSFNRWYDTAHLMSKPPIWPANVRELTCSNGQDQNAGADAHQIEPGLKPPMRRRTNPSYSPCLPDLRLIG